MKKQFTLFLAGLTVTALLAGCGKQDKNIKPEETTNIINEVEESVHNKETIEETTQETTQETEVISDKVEEVSEATDEAAPNKEEVTEEVVEKAEDKKEEQTSKPVATKPTNSTTTSQSASMPVASTKPQQTTQTAKPVVSKPSAKPEEKPVAKPEVKPEAVSLTSDDVFAKVTSDIDFSDHLALDSDLLRDYYGIDESLLEDYCVKLPMMSMQITEVGIFRVKDANDTSRIVDCINQRVKNVGHSLYPSLEETYEARVVSVKGNYVLFAIAEESASIETTFNSLLK